MRNSEVICRYYPDTDMLYIELSSRVSSESEDVSPGIVLDYDKYNKVVGIEVEDATQIIDFSKLELSALPVADLIVRSRLPLAA